MKMLRMAVIAAGAALAVSAPAQQQQGPAEPPAEKINQVLVYGDQPCPAGTGDEIVVCVRSPDEQFRIPKTMRDDSQAPDNQAWANRARSVEYVGRTGTQSCSTVGGGGFTGCFNRIVQQARAERMGDSSWTQLVEAERAKRLGRIDAESDEVEAQAKADEAAAAAPAPR